MLSSPTNPPHPLPLCPICDHEVDLDDDTAKDIQRSDGETTRYTKIHWACLCEMC